MDRRDLLKTAGAFGVAGWVGAPAGAWSQAIGAITSPTADTGPREVLSLNKGWRFFEGDIPFPNIQGHGLTYANAKAGQAQGGAATSFDDSEWPIVALPHDFASDQPIEADANIDQGYRKRGIAWYRNTLRFEHSDRGKSVELQLDGAATLATVWFNGTLVCHNYSGYNSAYIDLTPYLTYGDVVNSLVVRVDAQAMQGWWYEGAGLYRNAWIVKRAATHIITDGVFAHPIKDETGWLIPIEVTLNTIAKTDQDVTVISELWGDGPAPLARAETPAHVPALQNAVAHAQIRVAEPKLWSVDAPNLYRVVTRVVQGGVTLDQATTPCGFRTQHFDPDKGFFLNGQPLKIQGVCMHQDHAGVGVAVPPALIEFRLRKLKSVGCNAIRGSHNAQDKLFMDLCDRLGIMVMNENRLFNPSPDYLAELNWLVRRDRNHPCVILWSVFNEEPMQGTEAGYEMVRRMREAVRELDVSRPVIAAMNTGYYTPINVSQTLDVMGFNYNQDQYDTFHRLNPTLPMMSSEDTSAYETRGAYKEDLARHVMADNDDHCADWGEHHRQAWKAIHERPFVAGGFVWTGFDYHGEPTPFQFPSNSSLFGIFDLCGFEKAAFLIHQAQWVADRPVLGLSPHWTWPGQEGQPIKIMACSNLEEVEVLVNGTSLGKQTVDYYEMNFWSAPYQPGRVDLIGYKAGHPVARTHVETADPAVRLKITPDRPAMKGDGWDVQPFRVEAVDHRGRFMPLAQHMVTFALTGAGEIIGLGNGDPTCLEPEKGDRRSLFNGLAQVIVRAKEGGTGDLVLTANADGLQAASAKVKILAAPAPAYQAVTPPTQLVDGWLAAPASAAMPDPAARPAQGDMNSWQWFPLGTLLKPLQQAGYTLCAADFTPYSTVRRLGGSAVFALITGACAIYVDGQLVANKSDPAPSPFEAKFPPAQGPRRISVIFHTAAGETFGLGEVVQIRA